MGLYFIDLSKDFTERFELERYMEFNVDNYDILTSAFLNELASISASGRITVQGQDSRPDLISYEVYGDVQYWWIILYYNGLSRIDELVNGMELKYPSLADLEAYYFSLKSRV